MHLVEKDNPHESLITKVVTGRRADSGDGAVFEKNHKECIKRVASGTGWHNSGGLYAGELLYFPLSCRMLPNEYR